MDLTGGHPNGDGVDDGCVLKDGRHVVSNDDSRRFETSLHSEGSIILFLFFSFVDKNQRVWSPKCNRSAFTVYKNNVLA